MSLGAAAMSPATSSLFMLLGSIANLVILAVFGIWGLRLGARSRGGDDGGGGGWNGPEPGPEPPPGGRELTDDGLPDFAAWEEQLRTPEPEPAAEGRERVPANSP
jgi:hypothetical protein